MFVAGCNGEKATRSLEGCYEEISAASIRPRSDSRANADGEMVAIRAGALRDDLRVIATKTDPWEHDVPT